jgi:DNA repair exonuclease SbcCD ATPase subunit
MITEELQKLEKLAQQASKKLLQTIEANEQLKNQLSETTASLAQREQEIEHFKNKIKISNIVDNRPVNPGDSSEMSDLINNYIQEIDHLITYLSE